ncbi:MAG: DNA recombination protein RmuC [Gammaproteobacteria bacterium]|jgi:DNA recombination protein RmuC
MIFIYKASLSHVIINFNVKSPMIEFYYIFSALLLVIIGYLVYLLKKPVVKEDTSDNDQLIGSLKADNTNLQEHATRLQKQSDKLESEKGGVEKTLALLQDQWKLEFEALKDIRQLLTQGGTKAGDVGETVLQTLLESAGLKQENEEGAGVGQFFVDKKQGVNDEGGTLRPDIVILLPENKRVVIDSKVSLVAYAKYLNASSDGASKDEIGRHKTDHHLAVKKHIDDLAKKKYHDLLGDSTLEMTVMFMASEGAYIEALEVYADYSFKQKVAMVGPTTLMPIIKIIHQYWKIKQQNDNVSKIIDTANDIVRLSTSTADEYVKMYDSLNKFLGQVKGAGKRLVRLNDKASKMSKMGLSIDVKDHEINKLDLDDQSTVNKESDK